MTSEILSNVFDDILGQTISDFHDQRLTEAAWPRRADDLYPDEIWHWIEANHRFNCSLWEEDQARRRDVDQAHRSDVEQVHRGRCAGKAQRLSLQRADLQYCLDTLLQAAIYGRAYYRVYRRFKMYNDPRLNPYLSGMHGTTPQP